jgi:OmpA family protein
MRMLILGIAGLALAAPPALAQEPPRPAPTSAVSQQTEPGRYWVFFDLNRSDLRPDARAVVAQAAESFQRAGSTRISLVGSADRTGPPAYNEALSRRRADAVRTELERLGVPASVITVSAEGENAPIVPTAQGVREARNRYVAIDFPARAAPPPVAAAPPPAPPQAAPPPPPPPPPPKWALSLGPWYGHNLKETNSGNQTKKSDLVGPELRLDYALSSSWSLYGDLVGFNTISTSSDNGWGRPRGAGSQPPVEPGRLAPLHRPEGRLYRRQGRSERRDCRPRARRQIGCRARRVPLRSGCLRPRFPQRFQQGDHQRRDWRRLPLLSTPAGKAGRF